MFELFEKFVRISLETFSNFSENFQIILKTFSNFLIKCSQISFEISSNSPLTYRICLQISEFSFQKFSRIFQIFSEVFLKYVRNILLLFVIKLSGMSLEIFPATHDFCRTSEIF